MQGKKIASRGTWSMFHLTTSLERVGRWTPLSKLVKPDVSLIPSAASSLSGQKRCPRTTALICLEVGLRSRRAKISVRLQDPPSAQVLLNQTHITIHLLMDRRTWRGATTMRASNAMLWWRYRPQRFEIWRVRQHNCVGENVSGRNYQIKEIWQLWQTGNTLFLFRLGLPERLTITASSTPSLIIVEIQVSILGDLGKTVFDFLIFNKMYWCLIVCNLRNFLKRRCDVQGIQKKVTNKIY